jgi:hypothetical protein
MTNNKLIPYKENIFTKISNFIKKLFSRKKEYIEERIDEKSINHNQQKNYFIDNILIKEDEEEKRLKILQLRYDNGEIDEEDISDEDMDKLIEMYEKETEELNAETEKIKIHISQMLKELKQS